MRERCPHCAAPSGSLHDEYCPSYKPLHPATTPPHEPLSPEAQAVLERAAVWRLEADEEGLDSRAATIALLKLRDAVDAWQATQKPKDYAPEELKPGTRFKTDDPLNPIAILMCQGPSADRCYRIEGKNEVWPLKANARIIPIQDQD